MTRLYPDEVAGPFDAPPKSFMDKAGREVTVDQRDGAADALEDLVAMYLEFDPEDRAQGIPPTREPNIRDWLDRILTDDCINVTASVDGMVIGHATLVPDTDEAYELAIFVLGDYQEAGIGTGLITALLGAGEAEGIRKVWLTVERWNTAAQALYRKVGFEASKTESFELEMAIRLAPDA